MKYATEFSKGFREIWRCQQKDSDRETPDRENWETVFSLLSHRGLSFFAVTDGQ